MEIRQLNTFITIARLGSFTQAAEELGYAQSTITTQIQLLEKTLGIRLFERLGRNVFLTLEGEKFLSYAQQIIKLCSEAKSNIHSGNTPKGTLSIGAIESLCVVRLPELYKEYHKRYPDVEVVMKMGSCTDFKHFLRNSTIDVAFILDRKITETDLITAIELEEPMVLLAEPNYSLVQKSQVLPKDFENERLILTESGCSYRMAFESILNKDGVKTNSILETGSIQAIKLLVMGGLGVTLLPRIAVEEELKRNQLAALNWAGRDFGMKTQMVYHKDKWMSPALKAFIDLAREMLC